MNGPTPHEARNAAAGMVLFVVYVAFYFVFVMLSAFHPTVMAMDVGGVNLAIVYGFGLILLAFVMALVYMGMTRGGDIDRPEDGNGNGEDRA